LESGTRIEESEKRSTKHAMTTTIAAPPLLPLRDRVLLRRLQPAASSKVEFSGFVIPDVAKEKPQECEVVAVSQSYQTEWGVLLCCPVAVGQHVLIGKYTADHEVRGEKFVIARWDELLGVVQEAGEVEEGKAAAAEPAEEKEKVEK
jgi:chaperonin GroES